MATIPCRWIAGEPWYWVVRTLATAAAGSQQLVCGICQNFSCPPSSDWVTDHLQSWGRWRQRGVAPNLSYILITANFPNGHWLRVNHHLFISYGKPLLCFRLGSQLRSLELPCDLITVPILHELANKCPNVRNITLDFSKATQVSQKCVSFSRMTSLCLYCCGGRVTA